jgi:hypothetical protein
VISYDCLAASYDWLRQVYFIDDHPDPVDIAVEMKGVEEAPDGEPEEVLMDCLREIRARLRIEKARIC